MTIKRKQIEELFKKLMDEEPQSFPETGKIRKEVTTRQGVYIIFRRRKVLHVGRTYDGKEGLRQRLNNHLGGASSFVKNKSGLNGKRRLLRNKIYKYKYIKENGCKRRAYLEAYTTGRLCPEYIGLGKKKAKKPKANKPSGRK